ncbi:hypothetical protein [Wolbachia pipientis]|uniref:hypothetical protein n=1 Tax=Wolbachia pipientis TaxID=955 RepID=UPI0025A34006|nr:hypothetical protein [Wolbachia pipientis]MDM8335466.1 hypothetical protein [Wolbachia pipientis]
MSSSTPEEKKNLVATLKAQAKNFNFSMLRVSKDNAEANSGYQAYKDIDRMNFVIDGKSVDKILIKALINRDKKEFDKIWEEYCQDSKIPKKTDQEEVKRFYNLGKEHAHLLLKKGDKNYYPFAKQVFIELFKYAKAKAEVPSDFILEELITNCNQAGYEAASLVQVQLALGHLFVVASSKRVMNISYIGKNQNNVSIRSDMKLPIFLQNSEGELGDEVCDLSSSLEFTLESQNEKDGVTYTNGTLSLVVPRKLRDYKMDGRSLFDLIKEYFYKFCEKLGFKLETKIEHSFGELRADSYLKGVQLPLYCNEHGNTP